MYSILPVTQALIVIDVAVFLITNMFGGSLGAWLSYNRTFSAH